MLSMFFINDSSNGIGWRLKRHSVQDFFKWIAEWAIMIKSPTDLGFDGSKYNLPKLNIETIITESPTPDDQLFSMPAETLQERREARKNSMDDRVKCTADIVSKSDDQVLVWCNYNDESAALKKAIPDSYEVKGSDTPQYKEDGMIGFSKGEIKVLVSKPSICGFGMNWQNCHRIVFCGLSDSYEQFYQAIRR